MDRHEEFKGHYFVMDNAPIHKHKDIKLYVESRGYGYVHLPPYSPELNLMSSFGHSFFVTFLPLNGKIMIMAVIKKSCTRSVTAVVKRGSKRVI